MRAGAIQLTTQTYRSLFANWRALPRILVEPTLCAIVLLAGTAVCDWMLAIDLTMPVDVIRRKIGIAAAFDLIKSIVIWLAVAPVLSHSCRHLLGRGGTSWSKLGLATWSVMPAWALSGVCFVLAALLVSLGRQLVGGSEISGAAELLPHDPISLAAIIMVWCVLSARLFLVMALRATMTPGAWRAAGEAMGGRRLQLILNLWLTVLPPILALAAANVTGGDLTEIMSAALLALMAASVASNLLKDCAGAPRSPAPTPPPPSP